jgi:hypothetical protein
MCDGNTLINNCNSREFNLKDDVPAKTIQIKNSGKGDSSG